MYSVINMDLRQAYASAPSTGLKRHMLDVSDINLLSICVVWLHSKTQIRVYVVLIFDVAKSFFAVRLMMAGKDGTQGQINSERRL